MKTKKIVAKKAAIKIIAILASIISFSVHAETIEIDGYQVHYKISNQESKSPCEVYVHGNSADSSWMEPTVNKRIEMEKCVLSFDLPGHGKSKGWDKIPFSLMQKATEGVIRHSKVEEHESGFNLIGWSYGGDTIINLLPKKFKGLKAIVIAGTPLVSLNDRGLPSPLRTEGSAKEVLKGSYHLVGNLNASQQEMLAEGFLCPYNAKCKVPENLLDSVKNVAPQVREGVLNSFKTGEFKDEFGLLLNRGDIKFCMFYAQNDALASSEYMEASAKIVKPDYLKVFNEGGHAMFLFAYDLSLGLDECFEMM